MGYISHVHLGNSQNTSVFTKLKGDWTDAVCHIYYGPVTSGQLLKKLFVQLFALLSVNVDELGLNVHANLFFV